MAKEYMIGTLGDYPLLKVTLDGVKYFVNEQTKAVFLDAKGIPEVEDEEIIAAVLEQGGVK